MWTRSEAPDPHACAVAPNREAIHLERGAPLETNAFGAERPRGLRRTLKVVPQLTHRSPRYDLPALGDLHGGRRSSEQRQQGKRYESCDHGSSREMLRSGLRIAYPRGGRTCSTRPSAFRPRGRVLSGARGNCL